MGAMLQTAELRIRTPRALLPLLKPSRYKGMHGGRGGMKSHGFADLLLEHCILNPGTRAVCIREYQKTLEQSVKRLLEDKIKAYGLGQQFKVLNTHITTPGDGIIIFVGMQDHNSDSIKSLEGFDIAWFEEAQTMSARSLKLLRPTLRKEGSEIWFSWNPQNEDDPVEFLRKDPPPNSIVLEVNWPDNPFFPETLRQEMEWDRSRDIDKYEHVWMGAYERHSEARVFKNWVVREFEVPDDAHFLQGADWGYSIDPAVLVRSYIEGRKLYICHESHAIGVEIDHLPDHFDRVPNAREWVTTADSNRPDTISYMKRHGYKRMEAAVKGPDSIKEGVIFLQGYDIIVHPRCKHTIQELKAYKYKVDKLSGKVTPILEDKKNHVIDSLRYSVEQVRKRKAGGVLHGKATW